MSLILVVLWQLVGLHAALLAVYVLWLLSNLQPPQDRWAGADAQEGTVGRGE